MGTYFSLFINNIPPTKISNSYSLELTNISDSKNKDNVISTETVISISPCSPAIL
tara:strand:- start:1206 stop:1370 length:165 start_codon:yes stop_codon:yes gene_type:complete